MNETHFYTRTKVLLQHCEETDTIKKFGVSEPCFLKSIDLFSSDALNWSKVTVNTFINNDTKIILK